jgi:hypothetical protein
VPDTAFQCSLIDKPSNNEILKRQSNAAENRDLSRFRPAWMHPGDDFTKFRVESSRPHRTEPGLAAGMAPAVRELFVA